MNPIPSLERLGWDQQWSEVMGPYVGWGMPGRVAGVDRGLCSVLTADGTVRASLGSEVLAAMASDATQTPCTGDWVMVRHWPDGPTTLELVLPRRTVIVRAHESGDWQGHVLTTNVDVVCIVVAMTPRPSLGRIERFLALARESGARPVVIVTKADSTEDDGARASVLAGVEAASVGAEVIACSSVTGVGLDDVRALLAPDATVALLGASGHGKSTLTNALVGAELLFTREIRDDGKARHAGIRRELVVVPSGGCVIDTPGPLPGQRLESWRTLQRELLRAKARTDGRLRAEQKHRFKELTRSTRPPRRHH